jgi:transposase
MNADLGNVVRRMQDQINRLTAENCQMRATIERLEHDNARLVIERDEARGEAEKFRLQHAEAKRSLGALVQAIRNSDERLRSLVRREFGASSERSVSDQEYLPEVLAYLREHRLIDEKASATEGHDAARDDSTPTNKTDAPRKPRRRPANAGGRKPLPADFERREVTFQPPADHPELRHAASVEFIGKATVERWHVGSPELHIQVIHCPVANITSPTGLVRQATLAPPAVITRGQASDEFLVQSAVDKVVDHLPSYRQERRLQRIDVHLPRAKLCRWHICLATFLAPVVDAILAEILAASVIGIDDTVHRQIVSDRHTCLNGRLWAVSADPGIFYQFAETREGKWIEDLLVDYCGPVMGDAYAGHNQLLGRSGILALFCWAHVRRKFFEAADQRRRAIMLELIGKLYGIEEGIRELSPSDRVNIRKTKASPILARIKELLDAWAEDPDIHPTSGIGKATSYALNLWKGLIRYVDIGEAPIDNNRTERGMRPNALHRKNSLFSASEAGAKAFANLLTITQSALVHDLDPVTYLNEIILDMHYQRRPVADLTPMAYAQRVKQRCPAPL